MPKFISVTLKDKVPDLKVETELLPDELEKFLETFPEARKSLIPPPGVDFEPATITVRVIMEANKKKS